MSGPSFIGVGPEKTGTTWIDSQLRRHPDVWLPPIKEIRYFWEAHNFPKESWRERLFDEGSWHREQYRVVARALLTSLRHPLTKVANDWEAFSWKIRYLLHRHTESWYRSSFPASGYQVTGEISPQYFFLPPAQIQYIHSLLPETKIIVSLRKPVDWIWSFASMNSHSGFLHDHYGSLDNYIDSKIAECSYSNALLRWMNYFDDEHLLVLFYDDLENDPWAYLKNICTFLGIEANPNHQREIGNYVNKGKKPPVPHEYAEKIQSAYKEDMVTLSSIVPRVPASWL